MFPDSLEQLADKPLGGPVGQTDFPALTTDAGELGERGLAVRRAPSRGATGLAASVSCLIEIAQGDHDNPEHYQADQIDLHPANFATGGRFGVARRQTLLR